MDATKDQKEEDDVEEPKTTRRRGPAQERDGQPCRARQRWPFLEDESTVPGGQIARTESNDMVGIQA